MEVEPSTPDLGVVQRHLLLQYTFTTWPECEQLSAQPPYLQNKAGV